jgi:hypothetical protein
MVFGVVPFVAGLDKFFNLLVHWDKYIAPPFAGALPVSPTTFMHLIGIVEMAVGLLVLFAPWQKVMGWVVAAWLWCIALNLILGGFYDIAVRDIAMGISAATFARLSLIIPVAHHAPGTTGVLTEAHSN